MPASSLEDWIKQLLSQPITELNRKYNYDSSQADIARQEVESLPDVEPRSFGSGYVSAHTLQELHQKIRGQTCEAPVWDGLIFYLSEPLPVLIAHDLIDRDIIISQLGHTRQRDEVQWRLASLVSEAFLTFVRDMFTKPTYTAAELKKLLGQHPEHWWMLDKWEHWALLSSEVQELEKEVVFHRWAWNQPKPPADWRKRPLDVPSLERYLEILADRKRKLLRNQQEEEAARFQAELVAQTRRLEVQLIAERMLGDEEIQRILSSKDPDETLALANNPLVPIQWIQKLVNCYGVKGARQIREAAEKNIQSRSSRLG